VQLLSFGCNYDTYVDDERRIYHAICTWLLQVDSLYGCWKVYSPVGMKRDQIDVTEKVKDATLGLGRAVVCMLNVH